MLTDFGICKTCGTERVPLTSRGICPKCRIPIAGMTCEEAFERGVLSRMEADGYLPVTGWTRMGRIHLFGYVHPIRSREGWDHLFSIARKEGVSYLRIGTPEEVMFPEEE